MYRDDKVRAEMAAQRLTDTDMEERTAALGNRLTRQTIALIRKGETIDPQLSTLAVIAQALGKDLPWIVETRREPEAVGAR